MPDGSARCFTSIGCYPLFYVTKSVCLCPACALSREAEVEAGDCNWEDPDLTCDDCGERIESAYAEEP